MSGKKIEIKAKGHKHILATHKSTWEITRDQNLSPRGDCIIGVSADIGAADLPKWLQSHLIQGKKITITLYLIHDGNKIEIMTGTAYGHNDLSFTNTDEMVFRTSEYVCGRTVAIRCNFAARDINREYIDLHKTPTSQILLVVSAMTD